MTYQTYRVVAYRDGQRIGGVSEVQLPRALGLAQEWGQRRDEDGNFWADRVEVHDNSPQSKLFLEIHRGATVVDFLGRIRHDLWGKKKVKRIPTIRRSDPPPPH